MTIKLARLLIIVWISNLFLTGCTGGIVDPVAGSPTVADAYRMAQHGKTTYDQSDDQVNQQDASQLSLPHLSKSDTQNGENGGNQASFESTLNAQFPTLPNPNSLLYVFGHYAGDDELPVPGHFVPFSLYTRIYYAMPNEVLMPYNDGQFIQAGNQ